MDEPLPDAYSANRPSALAFSASTGVPVTLTASSKVTVMLILEPMPYARSAFVEDTDSTDGATVSISMFFELPSE